MAKILGKSATKLIKYFVRMSLKLNSKCEYITINSMHIFLKMYFTSSILIGLLVISANVNPIEVGL